jgi:hypothetical protein
MVGFFDVLNSKFSKQLNSLAQKRPSLPTRLARQPVSVGDRDAAFSAPASKQIQQLLIIQQSTTFCQGKKSSFPCVTT